MGNAHLQLHRDCLVFQRPEIDGARTPGKSKRIRRRPFSEMYIIPAAPQRRGVTPNLSEIARAEGILGDRGDS